jgi:hypothetical protein
MQCGAPGHDGIATGVWVSQGDVRQVDKHIFARCNALAESQAAQAEGLACLAQDDWALIAFGQLGMGSAHLGLSSDASEN